MGEGQLGHTAAITVGMAASGSEAATGLGTRCKFLSVQRR
jgi:hypothetical protein